MTVPQDPVPWLPLGKTGVHYWMVQRMAKACGVDTAEAAKQGDLEPESWADMVTRCRSCRWVDGCGRWLSRHEADAEHSEPPGTCINADLLKLLSERQSS